MRFKPKPVKLLGGYQDNKDLECAVNKYRGKVKMYDGFMPEEMTEIWIELVALRKAVLNKSVDFTDLSMYLGVVDMTLKTINTAIKVNEFENQNRMIQAPYRTLDTLPTLEELKAFEKSRTG